MEVQKDYIQTETLSTTFKHICKFKTACEQARQFTKRPPQKDILELYSLYKQANVGDINTSNPSTSEAKAKWDAWNSKKGMNGKTAKEQYIAKVKSLLGTCA